MAQYLLIESRDPFESNDVRNTCDLGAQLRRAGHDVTLFLVQNGVLPARTGVGSRWFDATLGVALAGGVDVVADENSLVERGIGPEQLAARVRCVPIEFVVDRLAVGCVTIWH